MLIGPSQLVQYTIIERVIGIIVQDGIVQLDRFLIFRTAQRRVLHIVYLRFSLCFDLIAVLDLQVSQAAHGIRCHAILIRQG